MGQGEDTSDMTFFLVQETLGDLDSLEHYLNIYYSSDRLSSQSYYGDGSKGTPYYQHDKLIGVSMKKLANNLSVLAPYEINQTSEEHLLRNKVQELADKVDHFLKDLPAVFDDAMEHFKVQADATGGTPVEEAISECISKIGVFQDMKLQKDALDKIVKIVAKNADPEFLRNVRIDANSHDDDNKQKQIRAYHAIPQRKEEVINLLADLKAVIEKDGAFLLKPEVEPHLR